MTIRVRSILGRSLEHARVYGCHAVGDDLVLSFSADWMERNLLRRVETCYPVEDERPKQWVVAECLRGERWGGRTPAQHAERVARMRGGGLVEQLRKALLAREAAKAEATVGAQMQALMVGLSKGVSGAAGAPQVAAAAPAATKKRRGWNPAARAAAKKRMVAYWAKRKAKAR